ncbi:MULTISPECIES: hypothetical protein [unclassified Photobacterium]|uniref:hypothetical protein n=1 Tax=unclassified Photobacterium TaxID=2628852 RepID=UPI000D16D90A|nr:MULTISPECIES: hypothetical protein [unclassified Photobacterium]PSV31151.1 hypothetical protein C9J40_08880 [Photobacterium sp. GB-72]PSV53606.1 hypothetical protein C9J45_06015 [Photobacterium sp. GB-1]
MDLGINIIIVLLGIALSSVFLWVGMKCSSIYAGMPLSSAYCSYFSIVKVCTFSTLADLIPYVGFILSWVVLFYFLKKETEAEVGELIIMVLISKALAFVSLMFLLPIIS